MKAQVSITSQQYEYAQDFNTLTAGAWVNNSTLAGWYVQSSNGTALTNVVATIGDDFTNGIKSYGAVNNTDRAIGIVAGNTGTGYIGLHLKNASGSSISNFVVSYSAELWYNTKTPRQISFSYKVIPSGGTVDLNSTGWTVVSDLGTMPERGQGGNNITMDGNSVNDTRTMVGLVGLSLGANQELIIRWSEVQENNKNRVGIDNVAISAGTASSSTTNTYFLSTLAHNETGPFNIGVKTRWVNRNGVVHPDPFPAANTTYIIDKSYAVLTSSVTLPTGSKFVLGSGLNLTIPTTAALNGTIDVGANATLYIENSTLPTLGTVSSTSTIEYGAAPTVISTETYGNLQINGGVKKLTKNTIVKGNLRIKNGGKLDLGEHDLIMEDPTKFAEYNATSYIQVLGNGKVKVRLKPGGKAFIPVGNASGYTPIELNLASGTEDDFSVRVIDKVYTSYLNDVPQGSTIDSSVVNKTWLIEEGVKGGSNMNITLFWNATDTLRGFKKDSVFIAHYENGAWDTTTKQKATEANGMYSITRTGNMSFSPYAIMSSKAPAPEPLPVELLYFNAKRNGGKVTFEWATASEKDNEFFQVEQSLDGKLFREVGDKIVGAGNSVVENRYQSSITTSLAQTIYYRLKQTDFNGDTSYSKVVAVGYNGKGVAGALELYPNPSEGLVYLRAPYLIEGEASVTVFRSNGQEVLRQQVQVEAGAPIALDLSLQQAGVYFVKVNYADKQATLRLVLL
ncbi:T9SS type A sorting domain-containing protein [Rufibacter roseus]|uniref:T9SS type A sorting domain-containing protein n=1 Tax=Rufibacter roseus TaxID=1567108 RepID=A0ABW2DJ15_9BACT|nr:T9SS type A sorting domain-containing protein [Rufibacter roseus]